MFEVQGLDVDIGPTPILRGIALEVPSVTTCGLIGRNGAGKTTFINMVTGWLQPSGGTIQFDGRSILGKSPRAITRLGLCRSFQVPQVFLSETVFDNMLVAYGIAEERGFGLLKPVHTAARAAHVDEHLRRYQIIDYRDVTASALPQGVRKLLDIAMAMASRPKLVMLDEPTSGISIEEKFPLMDIIMGALRQEKTTVLFIEHDMEIVERYVARVLAFSQGEIICDAPTAEAMEHPKVRELVIGEKKSSGNGADGHV